MTKIYRRFKFETKISHGILMSNVSIDNLYCKQSFTSNSKIAYKSLVLEYNEIFDYYRDLP